MKWVVERDNMVEVLQDLVTVIEKSSVIPITSHVKLTIKGNVISMVTTDTKLQIKASINLASDQNIDEAIHTTVSAQKLLDTCRVAQDKEIVFNLEENKLVISFKQGSFSLLTQQAVDFPEIEDPEISSTLSLPQKVWLDLIKSSIFAVSESDHREALCGLLLEVEGSTVRFVGTNGHRLAIAQTQSDQALEGDFKKAILPKKSVQEMQRLFSDSDEPLSLSFQGDTHVFFKLTNNNITFTSNLIEGDYPTYQAVIPTNNPNTLKVNKEALNQAITNAVIIQKTPPRTVEFMIQDDSITVSSNTYEGENSRMLVNASFDGKENIEMSFNEEYIHAALKSFEQEMVDIKIGSSNGSILIDEEGETINRQSVIMPLNN
jgi:DNA polymerase-3 subunit beta